jgi:hypothetical protein
MALVQWFIEVGVAADVHVDGDNEDYDTDGGHVGARAGEYTAHREGDITGVRWDMHVPYGMHR